MLTPEQVDAILREIVAAGTTGYTPETFLHHQNALGLLQKFDAENASATEDPQ